MSDEPLVDKEVKIFKDAMLAKIVDGWLVENFNLEEAMQPPPFLNNDLTPPKDPNINKAGKGSKVVECRSMSASAVVADIVTAIVLMLACLFVIYLLVD